MIYFDNAATTYPKPECVKKAMIDALEMYSFNAGRGSYIQAENTYKMIQETRQMLADEVSSSADDVIFTSSATEALNNIIYGLNLKEGDAVFVSPFEHNAVIRTLANCKCDIIIIPFSKDTWLVDEDKYEDLLKIKNPKAIIISHISNVTGFELPYECIFSLAKKNCDETVTILDCAQSFVEYNMKKGLTDFVVFAGHKSLYSVFGIAGYINITGFRLNIYKVGGTGSDSLNINMPESGVSRFEAGSLNAPAIYTIHESLKFLKEKKPSNIKKELTTYLIKKLEALENITLYLPSNYISNGIVSFNLQGYSSDDIGTILANEFDICVRTGYHCAPYVHDFIGSKEYGGTIRVSLGIFNTYEEIDSFIEAIVEILEL